jgi:aryl-alcohol dehydrogenase-like predicted oxidoreductase
MDSLINRSYAFYWEISGWGAAQIRPPTRWPDARTSPSTVEQPKYNMFHRERVEREYAPL